jgi:hypothetical protein
MQAVNRGNLRLLLIVFQHVSIKIKGLFEQLDHIIAVCINKEA